MISVCCGRYTKNRCAKKCKNAATTFAKIAPNYALLAAEGHVVILSFLRVHPPTLAVCYDSNNNRASIEKSLTGIFTDIAHEQSVVFVCLEHDKHGFKTTLLVAA